MGLALYAHNRTAYDAVLPMLEACRHAAVIHPTGTGKSFIAFQLIEGPKRKWRFEYPLHLLHSRRLQAGQWLARQKSAKRAPGKHSNCVMTPERIQKLEKIGVVWDAAE